MVLFKEKNLFFKNIGEQRRNIANFIEVER
jgi:hypothetical protein